MLQFWFYGCSCDSSRDRGIYTEERKGRRPGKDILHFVETSAGSMGLAEVLPLGLFVARRIPDSGLLVNEPKHILQHASSNAPYPCREIQTQNHLVLVSPVLLGGNFAWPSSS